jgi:c-di-GMP phosphodiesterase
MNIMLARQPIFHKADRIAGYELLSRSCSSAPGSGEPDQILVDVFLGPGIGAVTGGLPAFLTVSRELLLSGSLDLLSPHLLVLQIDAPAHEDPELYAVCTRMASAGYRFALDHYTHTPHAEPLLELGPFVKLDVARHGNGLPDQVAAIRDYPVLMLAENVENRAMHDACIRMGIDFFQGYLFSRPETFTRKDISVEHLRAFKLMRQVRDMSTTEAAIEEEFRADIALSYKLLRMVNSAASGGRGVRSIGHALRLLGRDALYRWLGLLLIAPVSDGGVDTEIALATLLRARMCELMANIGDRPLAEGTLFMIGLLSALESFMGIPVEMISDNLELAPELSAALTARRGPFGACLAMAESYEQGRWEVADERAREIGVTPGDLSEIHMQALTWAEERTRSVWRKDDDDGQDGAQREPGQKRSLRTG